MIMATKLAQFSGLSIEEIVERWKEAQVALGLCTCAGCAWTRLMAKVPAEVFREAMMEPGALETIETGKALVAAAEEKHGKARRS